MVELGQRKIAQSDFFTESTYQNSQNKTIPCYKNAVKLLKFAHLLDRKNHIINILVSENEDF